MFPPDNYSIILGCPAHVLVVPGKRTTKILNAELQYIDNAGMPTGTDFPYFVRKICANTEIRFMPFRVRITKKKKKKKKTTAERDYDRCR